MRLLLEDGCAKCCLLLAQLLQRRTLLLHLHEGLLDALKLTLPSLQELLRLFEALRAKFLLERLVI